MHPPVSPRGSPGGVRRPGDRAAYRRGVPQGPGWWPAPALFGAGLRQPAGGLWGRSPGRAAVAGSLLFSSYVKRVTHPVLTRLCLDGRAIDPASANVWVKVEHGLVSRVSFASAAEEDGDGTGGAPQLVRRLLDQNLAGAVAAVRAVTPLTSRTLWGSVASGVLTGLRSVSWQHEDPSALVELAREVLDGEPRLKGLCVIDVLPYRGREWFMHRRATCCLRYRVRPADRCAGCSRLSAQEQEARTLRMIARYERGRPVPSSRCAELGCPV